MSLLFSDQALELIENINTIATSHAAHSLATMLNDEVWVSRVERNPVSIAATANHQEKPNESFFVVHTEVVGEIKADTYLIVNAENENKICKKLLPSSTLGHEEMREGILMELDNILIAAMVTKYSNLFYRTMYGHVPVMLKQSARELNALISAKTNVPTSFSFRAELQSFKYGIHLEILASFDQTLVEPIRAFDIKRSYVGEKVMTSKEGDANSGLQGFFKKIFH